jgi:hypothetical protein
MLGIRILARLPGEAEYAQDYEILWSYEGPNAIEQLETVLETMEFDETHEYIVQIKKMENGAYVWKTTELL